MAAKVAVVVGTAARGHLARVLTAVAISGGKTTIRIHTLATMAAAAGGVAAEVVVAAAAATAAVAATVAAAAGALTTLTVQPGHTVGARPAATAGNPTNSNPRTNSGEEADTQLRCESPSFLGSLHFLPSHIPHLPFLPFIHNLLRRLRFLFHK
jgi:hypothetical protein